jgi:hypothetical protein
MPFAESPTKTYSETRKRTSNAYVKFSPDQRVVLRILNAKAKLVWKHWIPEANGGKGMMANCPNTTAQTKVCPLCAIAFTLPKGDEGRSQKMAKKRYIVNVLDRTPYTVCPSCNEEASGKKCNNCGADLKKAEFAPLNKVKLLEAGPQLFEQGLNAIAQLQEDDYDGADITSYDINFVTQGTGRDRKVNPTPTAPSDLPASALNDPETGEKQTLFDLDLLSEPTPLEEIELMLQGATMDELNAVRGIV